MNDAKHIHLIGICGTAMASLAGMLKHRGFRVTGSDAAAGPPKAAVAGATIPLGTLLFSNYLLPFEILSVLLLVAMVGVILLSKKELK